MTSKPDRPTRFAADLIESASAEGARQSRSTKAQLDHWVRVGRAVSVRNDAVTRRLEAALAGTLPVSMLTPPERVLLNAEIDAAVQERAQAINFREYFTGQGITTVALDEEGRLARFHPSRNQTDYW